MQINTIPSGFDCRHRDHYTFLTLVLFSLDCFYGTLTTVGYIMPDQFLYI